MADLLFETSDDVGAVFSPCRKYRYLLRRRWSPGNNVATFCMLNPSQADDTNNDPTILRCIGFAKRWNYNALLVVNLFAFISTDPKKLLMQRDPIGPDNNRHIQEAVDSAAAFSNVFVCAWGGFNGISWRVTAVLEILKGRELSALQISKDGNPYHPLYVPGNAKLLEFPPKGTATKAPNGNLARPVGPDSGKRASKPV